MKNNQRVNVYRYGNGTIVGVGVGSNDGRYTVELDEPIKDWNGCDCWIDVSEKDIEVLK